MTKPIYQCYLNKFTDAWYQLSEEEKEELMDKHIDAFEQLGIKSLIYCTMGGLEAEDWDFWGIIEYPDTEAIQKLRKRQECWGWFRYVEAEAVVRHPSCSPSTKYSSPEKFCSRSPLGLALEDVVRNFSG